MTLKKQLRKAWNQGTPKAPFYFTTTVDKIGSLPYTTQAIAYYFNKWHVRLHKTNS